MSKNSAKQNIEQTLLSVQIGKTSVNNNVKYMLNWMV